MGWFSSVGWIWCLKYQGQGSIPQWAIHSRAGLPALLGPVQLRLFCGALLKEMPGSLGARS